MILDIVHATRYLYSEPVFLNPHLFRLMPRPTECQQIDFFELKIHPKSVKQTIVQGIDGSIAQQAFFQKSVTEFSIEAKSRVKTQNRPYFVGSQMPVPIRYSPAELAMLRPFLEPLTTSLKLKAFAEELVDASRHQVDVFLPLLTEALFLEIGKEYRAFGWPYPPEETFAKKMGSCRDTAILWIALVRYIGIASRFVSGYIFDAARADDSELHAWAEVYIPGSGWRGFDPSYGEVVSERHVEICAGSVPELCIPVEGTFQGLAASSLYTQVTMARK